MNTGLFDPLKLGALELPNRIVMAPLTRCRASAGRVPNDLMCEYYTQRAGFGLIITEATAITAKAVGYPDTPGIWSEEQVEGWRKITDSVHAAGGRIVCQLWHVGRMSDPLYLNGEKPVAPSAIAPSGTVSLVRPEKTFETPRALELDEIEQIIADYRRAAENAKLAGFDGVELHAANGYLIDQFLQDSTNQRSDIYGGSVENRVRLLLQVTDELIDIWGAGRVGVHLSPKCDIHDMGDTDPLELFTHVVRELGERKIAFICAREGFDGDECGPDLAKIFGGPYIANQGFSQESAQRAITGEKVDAVAFGQLAIANPDLVERFENGLPLAEPRAEHFYEYEAGGASAGYTDYPVAGKVVELNKC